MKPRLFYRTTEQRRLKSAWHKVYANGIGSRSVYTQNEVKEFSNDADQKIRRLQYDIRKGTFIFRPAIGKRIPKKDRDDFRPLVVAPLETRIVQRSVLDTLLDLKGIQRYVYTPYSFGGIRKTNDNGYSSVPAAINAVLDAKREGLNYIRTADISAFFTGIRKSDVRRIIAEVVVEQPFLELFDNCVKVELSNLDQLREDARRFPVGELGVAQGSALSPLLGNILMYEFDRKMNEGDCKCFRYIDDLIFLGPSAKAVNARFRKANRLLKKYGMNFSTGKSMGNAKTFTDGFSFLGIELQNGLIRPDDASIRKFKGRIREILRSSRNAMLMPPAFFPPEKALLPTLSVLSGTIQGWSKHYRFCNDMKKFGSLHEFVENELGEYLRSLDFIRKNQAASTRNFLGVNRVIDVAWNPLPWPPDSSCARSDTQREYPLHAHLT